MESSRLSPAAGWYPSVVRSQVVYRHGTIEAMRVFICFRIDKVDGTVGDDVGAQWHPVLHVAGAFQPEAKPVRARQTEVEHAVGEARAGRTRLVVVHDDSDGFVRLADHVSWRRIGWRVGQLEHDSFNVFHDAVVEGHDDDSRRVKTRGNRHGARQSGIINTVRSGARD